MGEPKATDPTLGAASNEGTAPKLELKVLRSDPAIAKMASRLTDADGKPDAAVMEELGIVLAKNKRFGEAVPYLKAAYQQAVITNAGLSYLVRACYQQRDLNEATIYVKALLSREPDHLDGLKFAARICKMRKDWPATKAYWGRLNALRPRDPEPVRNMMVAAERMKDWGGALELAEDLRALDPNDPEVDRCTARCAIEMKETAQVEQRIERVAASDPEAALKLADLAIKRGLYAIGGQAIVAARDVVSRQGGRLAKDIQVRSREWAEEWVGSAMRAEMDNDIATSTELYRAARTVDEGFEPAVRGLDRLRNPAVEAMREAYKTQDYPLTVSRAREVIAIDPDFASAYLYAGRALASMDDPTAGYEFLSKGIEVSPNDPWMQLNFGRVAERSCEFSEAHRAYSKVLSLPRKGKEGAKFAAEAERKTRQLERAAIRETRRLYKEEQYDEAREQMKFLREINADPEIVTPLFDALVKRIVKQVREYYHVRHERTYEEAAKLLDLDPTNDYALKVAGRMMIADKDYLRALPHWETLAQVQPDMVEAHLQKARCFARMGEPARAFEAAEQVLALEPGHAEAQRILARGRD
ncbi:MAG: hypothetical protein MRY63_02445 [Neomegalonema sp.]|nr:hypothetical protein [Neomegalonema sp.]